MQQMFDRILVFEVYVSTPSSRNAGKKNNILFSAADHDSVTKHHLPSGRTVTTAKMYDFNRPLEALKMHTKSSS